MKEASFGCSRLASISWLIFKLGLFRKYQLLSERFGGDLKATRGAGVSGAKAVFGGGFFRMDTRGRLLRGGDVVDVPVVVLDCC